MNNIKYKKFKIDDVFEIIKTKKIKIKKSQLSPILDDKYNIGAITSQTTNNGIAGYLENDGNITILNNVFTGTANGNGKVFFQTRKFTILQDSYAFTFKNKEVNTKKVYAYFLVVLNNIYKNYNFSNKSGWNKIKNNTFYLPVDDNGNIDFAYIESLVIETEKRLKDKIVKFLIFKKK